MKGVKIVLYVGAVLFAVYSIVNLGLSAATYSAYIEYYGLEQVLPTILEGFFSTAGWAFVLFGLGALCGAMGSCCCGTEPQAASATEAEDCVPSEGAAALAEVAPDGETCCQPVASPVQARADEQQSAMAAEAEIVDRDFETKTL